MEATVMVDAKNKDALRKSGKYVALIVSRHEWAAFHSALDETGINCYNPHLR